MPPTSVYQLIFRELRWSRPSSVNLPWTSELRWHEPALLRQAATTAGMEGWRDFVLSWGRHCVRSPRPHEDEIKFFFSFFIINTVSHHHIYLHGTLFIEKIPSIELWKLSLLPVALQFFSSLSSTNSSFFCSKYLAFLSDFKVYSVRIWDS
jgi:hypothetical protein